ncbi:uncharacterized protein LOC144870456 [Branchiostoma floridae x Branchiostoma japonicum]
MEKYTILHELGQGAFSKVYKAERNGSTHALKCLTVDLTDNVDVVLKEIRALQRVGKHPNILQFTDVITEGAGLNTTALNVWLVLDYCNGGTLDSFIFRENPDRATVLQLLCDTAEGVAYLHGKNVVHGSLKPDNILVHNCGQRPIAKIADFGIVPVCEQGGWDIKTYYGQTDSSTLMYLSPETIGPLLVQQSNLVKFTAKADVFALGLIIATVLRQTTDPAVPAADPADPGTDPADPAADPAVPATDPVRPRKLVPAVFVDGRATAVAVVAITHPGYPVAGMMMTSEPPGSPVKALVQLMLAAYPHQRPTSEQVLGILRTIINPSYRTNVPQVPPRRPYTVIEVPADDAETDSCKDDCVSCCVGCWRSEKGYKWYSCDGKGWGLVILLVIMWFFVGVAVVALIVFMIYMGKGDKVSRLGRLTD